MIDVTSPTTPDSVSKPTVKTWRAGTLTYTATGLAILFCWLLWGDFAWAVKDRAMGGGMMALLVRKFEASDTFTSFLIGSLPAALSIMVGPIIGYKSDRHRGRWGRRIPFLLAASPITVVGLVCLAFSPQIGTVVNHALGTHTPSYNTSVLLCIGVGWVVFELGAFVANATFGALINDVVPRELLGRFYGLFRALSLIAGIIYNYWVFPKAETYFSWIFIGLAVIYGGGFTLMCLNVKEGEYPATVPMDRGRATKGFLHAAKTYFQECFTSSYYWLYFITMGLSWQIYAPGIFGIYYAKSLHVPLEIVGHCTALMYVFSVVLAYPLGVLVDRFHPLRVAIIAQILFTLANLWSGLFVHDAFTFSVSAVATGVVSGVWLTSVASLGLRLLPKAEFAQFASAAGIVQALFGIVTGPAIGLFLDRVVHHNYRYTFFIGFGIGTAALLCNFALHRRFMKLGGPKNYVAPEFGGGKAAI
jgi:MFS family permease